jgi:hypothetical protein
MHAYKKKDANPQKSLIHKGFLSKKEAIAGGTSG